MKCGSDTATGLERSMMKNTMKTYTQTFYLKNIMENNMATKA
jgi:hypothetical protein